METLQTALGKFYFASHINKPPTFLQVVGWTAGAERPDAKRRYVYVRKVPLHINHAHTGGSWEIDYDIIKEFATQVKSPNEIKHDGNAIIIDGAHFLRHQSETIPQFNG